MDTRARKNGQLAVTAAANCHKSVSSGGASWIEDAAGAGFRSGESSVTGGAGAAFWNWPFGRDRDGQSLQECVVVVGGVIGNGTGIGWPAGQLVPTGRRSGPAPLGARVRPSSSPFGAWAGGDLTGGRSRARLGRRRIEVRATTTSLGELKPQSTPCVDDDLTVAGRRVNRCDPGCSEWLRCSQTTSRPSMPSAMPFAVFDRQVPGRTNLGRPVVKGPVPGTQTLTGRPMCD